MRTHTLATILSAVVVLSILACTEVENNDNNAVDMGVDADMDADTGPIDTRMMKVVEVEPTSIALKRRELSGLEGALDATLCFSNPTSDTAGFTLQEGVCTDKLLQFLSVEPNVDDIYIAPTSGFKIDSHSSGAMVDDNPIGRRALKIRSYASTKIVISDKVKPDTTFTLSVIFTVGTKVNVKIESVNYATPATN